MENCSKKSCLYRIHYRGALTLFVSTNFTDIISIRIAIGSGRIFIAQNIDVQIFHSLRKKYGI